MIDEIARTIETDEKRGGEKWSKSLIDKLRSYRSLRRHPFLFFFFLPSKRGDQPPILPVVRPAVFENDQAAMVRSFDLGQGSKSQSLASPGNGHLETRPEEWTHREPPRVERTRTFVLRNLGEQPSSPRVKKRWVFFLEIFTSPSRGSLIFHRQDPDAFKYGEGEVNGAGEVLDEFYFPPRDDGLGWRVLCDEEWKNGYGAWIERDRWPGVGLMGIQIMFARVIDRVSGFPQFSIKSILRLDDESEIYANEINSWNPIRPISFFAPPFINTLKILKIRSSCALHVLSKIALKSVIKLLKRSICHTKVEQINRTRGKKQSCL